MDLPLMWRAQRPIVWISDVRAAQVAFLIRVENRHERDFRQIEALHAAS